jgi:hypothetical protein
MHDTSDECQFILMHPEFLPYDYSPSTISKENKQIFCIEKYFKKLQLSILHSQLSIKNIHRLSTKIFTLTHSHTYTLNHLQVTGHGPDR